MDDATTRLIVVVALVAIVAGLTYVANRFGEPKHEPVVLGNVSVPAGVVLFSSTECSRCKIVAADLRKLAVPLREITHELESGILEEVGVDAVPLTLLVAEDASVLWQRAGRLSAKSLRELERIARLHGLTRTDRA
ncbi:MAG TPA: hypothetical protein ENG98_02050 [Actinobacteria bacterium]|nr:hypothetical protein BMS3Bbin02_00915 [bacterium BMS3Bbin02]HDL41782.1 hypothetical protein [Actinomycetota bacterium]